MKSKKINKQTTRSKIHWTHFFAVILLSSYFILSKVNVAQALSSKNTAFAFLQIYLFGIFFACLFLYIFSHESFFTFAKEIEKEEEKKEKKYLKKFIHHGKVFATLLIGVIGGPVFSSLTARLLINSQWYKYLIVILANIPSTMLTTGVGKSLVTLFNF